ncbi:MAG: hypothetical protein ACREO1_16180, partial [Arenimonas sp.]
MNTVLHWLNTHGLTAGSRSQANKKIKANTVKRFHYDSVEALKEHLYAYILNYNFNLKLRAIGRLTPFEAILDSYQKTPDLFIINPNHLIVGLNVMESTGIYWKSIYATRQKRPAYRLMSSMPAACQKRTGPQDRPVRFRMAGPSSPGSA